MPIAQWLEKLGMSEYIQRFAEHNVDLSVLGDLSDQDLKELGISIGHRRKILAAIRELPAILLRRPKPPRFLTCKTRQSSANSQYYSPIWLARPHSRAVWIRRTCVRSSQPIADAWPRPSAALGGSWRIYGRRSPCFFRLSSRP